MAMYAAEKETAMSVTTFMTIHTTCVQTFHFESKHVNLLVALDEKLEDHQ